MQQLPHGATPDLAVIAMQQHPAELLPAAFFLNGWVHALSAAEIATYLMFRELETGYPESSKDGVYVTEPTAKRGTT